jgi:diamine N-acetyltransferase
MGADRRGQRAASQEPLLSVTDPKRPVPRTNHAPPLKRDLARGVARPRPSVAGGRLAAVSLGDETRAGAPAPGPVLALRGARAALGPLRPHHAESLARWRTDHEVRAGGGESSLRSPETEAAWITRAAEDSASRTGSNVHFVVYDVRDDAPVGWTGLFEINRTWGTAVFGILLGERRGQGLGADATRLTLDWAFHVTGLHNVMLETSAWNEAAHRAYRAAGFRDIGRRRRATLEFGERHDTILMDATGEDFDSPVLAALRPSARKP